jgi:hypothetical protein
MFEWLSFWFAYEFSKRWFHCGLFLYSSMIGLAKLVIFHCGLYVFLIFHCGPNIIELDYGKNYRKALYLMVKTMVSCRFSLKPIHWKYGFDGKLRRSFPRCQAHDMSAEHSATALCGAGGHGLGGGPTCALRSRCSLGSGGWVNGLT